MALDAIDPYPVADPDLTAEPSQAYRILVLAMLLVAYLLCVIDRQIVSVLAIAIKPDLGLTDTQLGLMGGLAFLIFYCSFAIPIARLADLTSRSKVIMISLALWSLMTAACGFAQSFIQLFVARMGVGIGEAGGIAPSYSLISDYFPPHQRARALGVHGFGVPIGSAIGVIFGGTVATYVDWRWAFISIGMVGVAIVPLFHLIVKEPVRGRYDCAPAPSSTSSFLDVVRLVTRKRSFWYISLGTASASAMGYGTLFWLPSFFVRSFQITMLDSSLIFGGLQLLGGVTGLTIGGIIADRAGRRGRSAYMRIPAFAFLAAGPCYLIGLWSNSLVLTCAMLFMPTALSFVWLGPTLTAVQHLAPAAMRTTAAVLFMTIANVFGLLMGVVVLGAVSDLLARSYGAESLRYSIAAGTIFYFVAFILFQVATRTIERDWRD